MCRWLTTIRSGFTIKVIGGIEEIGGIDGCAWVEVNFLFSESGIVSQEITAKKIDETGVIEEIEPGAFQEFLLSEYSIC